MNMIDFQNVSYTHQKGRGVTNLSFSIDNGEFVFLIGPTGSGKEVLANYLHEKSNRKDEPFVAVNCAAIPENMLEAILFGHEKGAFTGASNANKGIFRAADKGTLLLDEISEMPLSLQAKLLRVLQERKVTPVGGQRDIDVDVRVLATSNRDMAHEVNQSRFREDLYYRLNVFPLQTRNLSSRKDDILPIAIKILENGSKLKCGIDFYYGYIPERLVEGDALNELKTIPQLISGQTDECLKRVQAICNFFFPKTIKLKSCAEAEIIKLATNSVRDLNFAFANEISRISNIYNLSGFEVIKKANQDYPRNNIAKPSVGVGGFCLPKDPFIFKKLLKNKNDGYRLSVSREVNSLATMENLKRVIKIKNKYLKNKKIKILIMGISFKGTPETIDIRNSVSLNLGLQLQKYKFHNVSFLDVMGKKIKDRFKLKIKLCNDKDLNKQDIILLTNNNPLYKDIVYSKLKNNTKAKKIIYDFTDMLDENLCSAIGYVYKKL